MYQENSTKELTVGNIVNEDNYVIPIYQRDYAWGNNEITQLIQDVADYAKDKPTQKYYIGTLVAYHRETGNQSYYEIIDGQQRFTTLFILTSLLKDKLNQQIDNQLNLRFDCRDKSTNALDMIYNNRLSSCNGDNYNQMIIQGYRDAEKAVNQILKESNLDIIDFVRYLIHNVIILRVLVPNDTNLNHYFEVMNTRGEQLEKHEVLKAQCLNILNDEDRYAFNLAWEACSDMERYVQYKFSPDIRSNIFGADMNQLVDLNNYYNVVNHNQKILQDDTLKGLTIEKIIDSGSLEAPADKKDELSSERFNTVINFSNFLLHILRIQTSKDIALDDKRLLDTFKNSGVLENQDSVRLFGYNLLRGKFYFDKYIIKREFLNSKDEWSLKRMKIENSRIYYVNTFDENEDCDDYSVNINRKILMLLSMFHVSTPTLVYKHWLNAALKYHFEHTGIQSNDYYEYLLATAKLFMRHRFLSGTPRDYYSMIYDTEANWECDLDLSLLNNGTSVENFVFNFTDFLLWLENENSNSKYLMVEGKYVRFDNLKFDFSFRSSVEHYYPQHPVDGNVIDKDICDSFGNLCLIDGAKNSKLSNHLPSAKKDYYSKNGKIDSLKQYIMMQYSQWDCGGDNSINEIESHGTLMRNLILENLAQ